MGSLPSQAHHLDKPLALIREQPIQFVYRNILICFHAQAQMRMPCRKSFYSSVFKVKTPGFSRAAFS